MARRGTGTRTRARPRVPEAESDAATWRRTGAPGTPRKKSDRSNVAASSVGNMSVRTTGFAAYNRASLGYTGVLTRDDVVHRRVPVTFPRMSRGCVHRRGVSADGRRVCVRADRGQCFTFFCVQFFLCSGCEAAANGDVL